MSDVYFDPAMTAHQVWAQHVAAREGSVVRAAKVWKAAMESGRLGEMASAQRALETALEGLERAEANAAASG